MKAKTRNFKIVYNSNWISCYLRSLMINWSLIIFVSKMAHYWEPASKLFGALSDGWAGKGRRDCKYVSGIGIPPPIPCGYPSTKLSDFSANVNKHWKARAKGNDVIANVISANQDFASTFSSQVFKFQRCSCKLSFIFPPRPQIAPESFLTGYIIGSLLLKCLRYVCRPPISWHWHWI